MKKRLMLLAFLSLTIGQAFAYKDKRGDDSPEFCIPPLYVPPYIPPYRGIKKHRIIEPLNRYNPSSNLPLLSTLSNSNAAAQSNVNNAPQPSNAVLPESK